ncbi:methyl-accepting chemotaxis protein [Roseateles saccharophilus]|uniref:Methyl-accepting chemotaxis protein n=1 Tax=Roseateles saccharophilus TaxID=304 RepID=A0A4R3VKP1_ROSSA|nr:methyl-accepting chemotaxis protein [Roseateles saccharophilus]MDG0831295.1 hypothetical protein [Roseateles saccharophilus]TCV04424.1 methyl-accepting chemotaxis protein [Roseateles saccharophilus]
MSPKLPYRRPSLAHRWRATPLAIKLAITPLLASAALAFVGVAGWHGLTNAQAAADEFNDERLPATEFVGELDVRIATFREASYQVFTQASAGLSADVVAESARRVHALKSETEGLLHAQTDSGFWDEGEHRRFEAITQSFDAFAKAAQEAVDTGGKDLPAAERLMTAADQQFQGLQEQVTQLRQAERQRAQAAAQSSRDAVDGAKTHLVVVGLVGLLLAATTASLQAIGIRRRLKRASEWAGRIAQGDLRLPQADPLLASSRDDGDRLLASLSSAGGGLTRLVGEIQLASEGVAQAAAQIAAGNTELSHRTETAAASLQTTSASVERIRHAVDGNAQSAITVERLAAETAEAGRIGFDTANAARVTMQELARQATSIRELVESIEGLAAQSHLLSLNAAVEAARAGEAGRGFAVVAGEVRSLARSSQALAEQIRQVVAQSVQAIAEGEKGAARMHDQMGRILEYARGLALDMQGISTASRSQASEVNAIHGALTGLDRDTQSNAALVEEASAAAQLLRDQAATLQGLVATFQLGDGAASAN